MSKYVDGITFITVECCNCGLPFAMTEDFCRRRKNDHGTFHCPAGHAQHYTGKSEEQKLREQLQHKQQQYDYQTRRAVQAERHADAVNRQYKRIRDRVKNGVCPCCNRTFENLARHMKTQHQDFGSRNLLKALRAAYGLTQAALGEEIGVRDSYISNFENSRPVPSEAMTRIKSWLADQVA